MNGGWAHFGQLEYSADEPGEVLLLPALEEDGANSPREENVAIDDVGPLVETDLRSILEVEVHLVAVSTDPRGLERASLVHPLLDEDSVELIRLLDNVAIEVESVNCTRLPRPPYRMRQRLPVYSVFKVLGEAPDDLPLRLSHTSHSSLSSRFADRTCRMKLQAIWYSRWL